MAEKKRSVSVSKDATAAPSEPQFIVEHEGKYYVSLAVLEFDPKHPKLKEVHRKGIALVQAAYKSGRKVSAVMLPPSGETFIDFTAVQTIPWKPRRGRG